MISRARRVPLCAAQQIYGSIRCDMFAEGAFGMVLYMYTFMYNILRGESENQGGHHEKTGHILPVVTDTGSADSVYSM